MVQRMQIYAWFNICRDMHGSHGSIYADICMVQHIMPDICMVQQMQIYAEYITQENLCFLNLLTDMIGHIS